MRIGLTTTGVPSDTSLMSSELLSFQWNGSAPEPRTEWRVLFQPAFHLRVRNDRRLPVHLGGYGLSGQASDRLPDESVLSFLLARLAAVFDLEETTLRSCRFADELRLHFTAQQADELVADFTLYLSSTEARLVGRVRRADLADRVTQEFIDLLATSSDELGNCRVSLGGNELGAAGGVLLAARPAETIDLGELLDRLLDGEEPARQEPDVADTCPIPLSKLAYRVASGPRTGSDVKLTFVQTVSLPPLRAWLFEAKEPGVELRYVFVASEPGVDPRIEEYG